MRIFRRHDVNDIPFDDVKAWFKMALRLQRDDADLFNKMLAEMESDRLEAQRTNFRSQGWSEEDIEVAAVASVLREARQEGVFKHEE